MAGNINNMFLINAPAGSGKTTYIENTIVDLLVTHSNKKILAITYTNRAKEELQSRIDNKNVTIDTIHSFLYNFISLYLTKAEVVNLYFKVFENIIISQVNKGVDDVRNARYIEKYGELSLRVIRENLKQISYNEQSFSSYYYGGLSHDDLLYFVRELFEEFKVLQKRLAHKYAFIFIDEYQDTSAHVLYIFYQSILNTASNLYLLGDKMQEIYNNYDGSFNNHLEDFTQAFNLTINYRCSPSIINILNHIYNDSRYFQTPYKYYESPSPHIYLTDTSSSMFNSQYENYLQLYLFNRNRFEQIGAGDLYNALSEMQEYKFPSQYTPVDVLTKRSYDNPDKLFRVLFCICEFVDLIGQRAFGKSIRLAREQTSVFNHSLTDIKYHVEKIRYSNKISCLKEQFDSKIMIIKEFCDFLVDNEYCQQDVFKPILENENYQCVLNTPLLQLVKLYSYLNEPKISTQHGVKGEGHDRVCFIAEDSSRNPITHMYDFFELFCSEDINLTDFQNFYYCYTDDLESIDLSFFSPADVYRSKKDEYIKSAQYISNKYRDNKYFSFCHKQDYIRYLENPTATNAKSCFRSTKTKGVLWGYKLFYVGCSRAKSELVILADKNKIAPFRSQFVDKMTSIGFVIE